MSNVVGILNIGLGNTLSIQRMIHKVGGTTVLIDTPEKLSTVSKLIMPGVGHFDHGISLLRETGFSCALIDYATDSTNHILGICLGMQLLCKSSHEGEAIGLGLIPATVLRFPAFPSASIKVPHMGWNLVRPVKPNQFFALPDTSSNERFYFVHSFYVQPSTPDIVLTTTFHGLDFCSSFQLRNIIGVQFHPEKSHKYGMQFFTNFLKL